MLYFLLLFLEILMAVLLLSSNLCMCVLLGEFHVYQCFDDLYFMAFVLFCYFTVLVPEIFHGFPLQYFIPFLL